MNTQSIGLALVLLLASAAWAQDAASRPSLTPALTKGAPPKE